MISSATACRKCGAPSDGDEPGHCFSCLATELLRPGNNLPDFPGQTLPQLDDFELLERIGQGGMGIVYRARQISLQRFIALKLIRHGEFANSVEVSRFRAEAEAVAGLTHPNIVSIYGTGEEQGCHYFSMQLVEGGSLASRLVREGPLSPKDASTIVARVARAVHYAHQRGILHRDLKPANVLLDATGGVFVSDFGLARRLGTDSSLTLSGQILGTPNYISPEQASGGRQLTVAADIFSLGAILYESVSGMAPFKGETVFDTLQKVVHETPAPPCREPDLNVIIGKCLEKDPARRYASAEALANDLECWLRNEPISARATPPLERVWLWSRRHRALSGSLALTVVAIVATAGIALAAAWKLKGERDRTRQAQLDATLKLAQSSLAQARAENLSRSSGFRGRALDAIATAASIRPSPDLRNSAINALSATDLSEEIAWTNLHRVIGAPAFNHDLTRAAQATRQGTVVIIDPSSGREFFELDVGAGLNGQQTFSPDGEFLAISFADGSIALWNLNARKECWRIHLAAVHGADRLAFHPTEPAMYVRSGASALRRVDLATGREVASVPLPWVAHKFAVSPDALYVAVTVGELVAISEIATGRVSSTLTNRAAASALVWHPDGRRIAIGNEYGEITFWDFTSGSRKTVNGEPQLVATLVFHPEGHLIASGHWNQLSQLWDVPTGLPVLIHRGGLSAAFSKDGARLAMVAPSIYRVERPRHLRTLVLPDHANFYAVAFSADGQWIATSSSGGLHLWKEGSLEPIASQKGSVQAHQIAFARDGRSIISRIANKFWSWSWNGISLDPPQEIGMSTVADLNVRDFAQGFTTLFPADLTYHFNAADVLFVDLAAPATSYRLTNFTPGALSLSRRTNWLATYSAKAGVIEIRSAERSVRLIPAKHASGVFLLNPRNGQLAHFSNGFVTMFSVLTGELLWERPQEIAATLFPAFNPTGEMLAIAGTSSAQVWIINPFDGSELAILPGPANTQVSGVAFSPDGRLLAVGHRSFVRLWDLRQLRRDLALLKLDWPNPVARE